MDEGLSADTLRARRRALGLSQAALAAALNVTANTVARWERGAGSPRDPEQVRKTLDELGSRQRTSSVEPAVRERHGVPRPLTSFVGRAAEVADVQRVLSTARLVTLVGTGGIGKTRLALECAATAAERHADGAALVELAPVADPSLVPQVVATALGLRLPIDAPALPSLVEALSTRALLLLLDNCEHVIDAAAGLANQLLQTDASLQILATSRQPLGVPGEIVWELTSLPVPDVRAAYDVNEVLDYAAVRLFVERAEGAAPGFRLTDRAVVPVVEICRRLDGVPLAIELAASRVRVLGVEQIAERLDDRFQLLIGAVRTVPERQQTLRATLDWSYGLLSEPERTLFRRLSVFVAGFTLEAAEAVCGDASRPGLQHVDVYAALCGLVDKSLVQVEGDGQRARYRLLETVRQYAAEQLAETAETSDIARRHRDWFVCWCEEVLPRLTRPDQASWYRRLAEELDNCRAARAWSRGERDGGAAELRLAGALARYWFTCGPGAEGREWLTQALQRGPETPSAARAQALTFSGQFECLHGDVQLGRQRVAEAVAVAREVDDGSLLSMTLRHQALYAGDHATAPDLLEEAARVAQAVGDARECALALGYLGAVYEQRGHVARAQGLYTEALTCARRSGDATALADALDRLGTLSASQSRYAEAAEMLSEGLAHAETIGFGMYTSLAHRKLGQVALARGNLAEARAHVHASLELARVLGRNALGLWPLQVAALLAGRLGQHERAVRLIAAATVWKAQHELRDDRTLWTYVLPEHDADATLSRARSALGDSGIAAAWAEGGALTLEAALDEALADDPTGAIIGATPADAPAADPRPTPRQQADDLTRREREVAELVGRGLSNRELAEQLVVTEGTAKVHVGRVLAKLGLHSRSQLAAWAVRQPAPVGDASQPPV